MKPTQKMKPIMKVSVYGAGKFPTEKLNAFPIVQFCFFSHLTIPTKAMISGSFLNIYVVKNAFDLSGLYSLPLEVKQNLLILTVVKKQIKYSDCFYSIIYCKDIVSGLMSLFSCLFYTKNKSMILTCNDGDFQSKKLNLYSAKSVKEVSSIIKGSEQTYSYILYVRGSESISDEIFNLPEVNDTELDISISYNYYDENELDITVFAFGVEERTKKSMRRIKSDEVSF